MAESHDDAASKTASVAVASTEKPKLNLLKAGHMLSKREMVLDNPPVAFSQRKCTDILFLLLFILYWIGMFICAGIGYQNGDPRRLIYATDHQGNLCGGDNKTDKPLAVYPRTSEDVFFNIQKVKKPWEITFFAVCVKQCPVAGDFICTDAAESILSTEVAAQAQTTGYDRDTLVKKCLYNPLTYITLIGTDCPSHVVRTQCWETLFNTTSLLYRCLPKYIYDVSIDPSTGCVESRNVTNQLTGKFESVCVKYKKVTVTTKIEPTASDLLFDSFNTAARIFNRYLGDIYLSYHIIIGFGLGFSILLGLFFIGALYFCIGPMVWCTVFGTVLVCTALTCYCYLKAGYFDIAQLATFESRLASVVDNATDLINSINHIEFDRDSSNEINGTSSGSLVNQTSETVLSGEDIPSSWGISKSFQREYEIGAWVMTAITVLLFFIILGMSGRISRAIEIFREAAIAIRQNVCLVFVPFVTLAFMLAMLVFWAATSSYIASSKKYELQQLNLSVPVNPEDAVVTVAVVGEVDYETIVCIYLFFGLLWNLSFLNGITTMITAGTIGAWYWGGAVDDVNGPNYGKWPMLHSIGAVFRFHLGTIAFGSLVVAIMQMIRYIAAYLDAKTKGLQKENKVIMVLLLCVHCFLKCVESCVKFISRNAYIQCAMYGGSFCGSARDAFGTIAHNLGQVATVSFLGDIILRFGQVFVTVLATLSCWMYLDFRREFNFGGQYELSSFWFPTFLTAFLAWFASAEVLAIYDVAIDTILLQYLQDKKLQDVKQDHKKGAGSTKVLGFFSKQTDDAGGSRGASASVDKRKTATGGRLSIAHTFDVGAESTPNP